MFDIIKCIVAIMTALVLIIGLKIGSLMIRIGRPFTSFFVFVIALFMLFIGLIFAFISVLMNNRLIVYIHGFMASVGQNSGVERGVDPVFLREQHPYIGHDIGAIGFDVHGTVQRDEAIEKDTGDLYNYDNVQNTDNDKEKADSDAHHQHGPFCYQF